MSLPVWRAIWNVFLAVHRIEREHTSAKAERGDQRLGGRDFVGLLVNGFMSEDDLVIDGKGRENMGGFGIGKRIETLPQRLSVYSDEA
jgi:hypothetical protein